jgi:uncharacterized protein YutE (UPF0331/DUF86 family)
MTDVELVLRKLAVLRDHLQRVRRRRPPQVDALLADQDLQDAICMSLLVAIQEAIDTAFHISADEGWGVPDSNAQAFEILARNAVLSDELARAMGSAAALRNRIAHGYAGVDLPRLWAEIPTGLDSLERYVTSVARLLASHDGSGAP